MVYRLKKQTLLIKKNQFGDYMCTNPKLALTNVLFIVSSFMKQL